MKLHPTDAAAPVEQQQLAKYFLIQRSLTRRVKNKTQHCKNLKSNPGGVHAWDCSTSKCSIIGRWKMKAKWEFACIKNTNQTSFIDFNIQNVWVIDNTPLALTISIFFLKCQCPVNQVTIQSKVCSAARTQRLPLMLQWPGADYHLLADYSIKERWNGTYTSFSPKRDTQRDSISNLYPLACCKRRNLTHTKKAAIPCSGSLSKTKHWARNATSRHIRLIGRCSSYYLLLHNVSLSVLFASLVEQSIYHFTTSWSITTSKTSLEQ